jgi:hypothetical protein
VTTGLASAPAVEVAPAEVAPLAAPAPDPVTEDVATSYPPTEDAPQNPPAGDTPQEDDAGLEQMLARTEAPSTDDDRMDEFERSIFEAAGRPMPEEDSSPGEVQPGPEFAPEPAPSPEPVFEAAPAVDPMATESAENLGDLDDMLADFLPHGQEVAPGPGPVGQAPEEPPPPTPTPELPPAGIDDVFSAAALDLELTGEPVGEPVPQPTPAPVAEEWTGPIVGEPVSEEWTGPVVDEPASEEWTGPVVEEPAPTQPFDPTAGLDAALGQPEPEPAVSAVDAALADHVTPPEPAREPLSAVDQALADHVPYDASPEPAPEPMPEPAPEPDPEPAPQPPEEDLSPVEAALELAVAEIAAETSSPPEPAAVTSEPQPPAPPDFDPLADYDPLAVLDQPESIPAPTPAFQDEPAPEPSPMAPAVDPAPPPAPEGSPLAALDALGPGAAATPQADPGPPPTGGDDLGALARRPSAPRPDDAEEGMATSIFVPSQQQAAAQYAPAAAAPAAPASGPRASWEPDFYELFQDARQQCEALADDQVLGELRRALAEVRKAGG